MPLLAPSASAPVLIFYLFSGALTVNMSTALAVIGNILAFLIFGLGLIAPLTPSEGMPSIGSLITFVGLPLVFILNAWRHYTHQISKYAVVIQAMGIIGFTGWLLLTQAGAFASSS
ncbi:hypothetical protein SAMN05216210_3076 [Halopseudomonas salegens]|uniref:Uncharacterized protein n=1 Tax=Halopseudomonas salegens TaxID=1434072 RepID=A0A1H2HIY1_9GAMM|nr:hypothetical protein SAMN05216210_3076 [Halopseudomonas salegens]